MKKRREMKGDSEIDTQTNRGEGQGQAGSTLGGRGLWKGESKEHGQKTIESGGSHTVRSEYLNSLRRWVVILKWPTALVI